MSGRSDIAALAARGRAFGRWWREELAEMLPARLRRAGPRHLLDLRGEAPFVARATRTGWRALLPFAAARRGAAIRALAAEDRLVLAVLPDWVLRRVLRLPEAAEARLDAVLGFEIEQHIPFAAHEVVWTARVLRRLPEQQRIEVEVAMLPRHLVAGTAAALREAGLVAPIVARPDPDAAWPGVPLDALAPPRRRWRSLAEAGLAAGVALLLLHLALQDLRQGEAAVAALEARAATARVAAGQVLALEERAAALRARLDLAAALRGDRPAAVVLLEELAERLPDEVWLSELRLTGDQLSLTGFAARADGLLELLHASPMLREVRFSAPVTRERRETAERFQIALRLVVPAAADPLRTAGR
ncbi:PilN domain-containing protein [Siccirubricoccus sp. G192]|uniref:PilN domain-containing protein n=1 Tax=Siccirubricoccus sp. G192 TaxID=2849651 RepID=UPI001C2BE3B3|nr:PilN domain-containing protein [Siccirubricoccus sp. G192]MBV1800140.1 PilN domain-containing protein [Siccirubricoccus sp. G192]